MSEQNLFETAERLKLLPPYLFARIDKIKQEEIKKGKKLIALGIGDPDLPTPDFVIERLISAAKQPANHQYPSYWGMIEFRQAVARWYDHRFGVKLNPENEVLALIGSKEGIAHIPLAFINPGEAALVPDPGYPVYATATMFAGGKALSFKLTEKNSYLPDFAEFETLLSSAKKEGRRTRLLFLNYPNNPTSACASIEFFEEVVRFAKKHSLIVCHDNAYSEIYFDRKPTPSFLQARGAMDVGCEFHSLSKTFNMTGWRVGFLVGNRRIVEALAEVKTNIDSGVFNACQEAGIAALDGYEKFSANLRQIYQERRDVLAPALQRLGLECPTPSATFYLWARLPNGKSSEDFVMELIRTTGIVSTPGNGFGSAGAGYVRFTICSDISILRKVAGLLSSSL
jgi:LL-diaminopimelate aminotransferase